MAALSFVYNRLTSIHRYKTKITIHLNSMNDYKQQLRRMSLEVEVRSREMIKPFSPTPTEKKTVKFSLIDQLATTGYIPMLLFYQKNDASNDISTVLKTTLSKALVDFYPLAGRIHGNEFIDCNDQGAEFCEAEIASSDVQTLLEKNPGLKQLQSLLPFQALMPSLGTPSHENIVLSVQLNHFPCGGICIGVCLSHKIADACATVDFLKAWAASHLNLDHTVDFNNGPSLFPPLQQLNQSMLLSGSDLNDGEKERVEMRRLIFDKKIIDGLKEQLAAAAAADPPMKPPTKVEVVTAFLCDHWPKHFSSIIQVVNLRKKMSPPILDGFMGNCAWFARTSPFTATHHQPTIIHEFRRAITKINDDYMKELLFGNGDFMSRLQNELAALSESPEQVIACNSLSGFPLYDVDFGMGKPVWACSPGNHVKNSVLTMSTACGQGIEAWVCLPEDDISKLDNTLSHLGYPLVKSLDMHN